MILGYLFQAGRRTYDSWIAPPGAEAAVPPPYWPLDDGVPVLVLSAI